MKKKLEPTFTLHFSAFTKGLMALIVALSCSFTMQAQDEDDDSEQLKAFKTKIEAFKSSQAEDYELKFLNIAERNLGVINETETDYKEVFMLRTLEKKPNNVGHNVYGKFFFSVFYFEYAEDRQYALKDWMGEFLQGQPIRPGRTMRTYPYASPTLILINDNEIIVCNYKCSDYSEENFKEWKTALMSSLATDNTMLIEVLCEGPLEWTKNPPDPKNSRKLF